MNPPVATLPNINPNWIYLTWIGITGDSKTGGDIAKYYQLEWDQGSSGATWISLTTSAIGLTYAFNLTSVLPFASGVVMKFRLVA